MPPVIAIIALIVFIALFRRYGCAVIGIFFCLWVFVAFLVNGGWILIILGVLALLVYQSLSSQKKSIE